MHESVKLSGSQYRWAELLPVVPRFGHSRLKRMMAYPQYLITPFGKLINKQRLLLVPHATLSIEAKNMQK